MDNVYDEASGLGSQEVFDKTLFIPFRIHSAGPWVADTIGRLPNGCNPKLVATTAEIQVVAAPVSMSAGYPDADTWAPEAPAFRSAPGASATTAIIGPRFKSNVWLRHGTRKIA